MSYTTDFICTYKLMDDEFEQDYLYKIQLLQAFGINTWNDEKASDVIMTIYNKIKDDIIFREILEKGKNNKEIQELLQWTYVVNECDEKIQHDIDFSNKIVFELLFRYDTFDLIHRCLSDYLREGKIKESNFENLIKSLT